MAITKRMGKKEYEEMVKSIFEGMKETGVSLEERILTYFDKYSGLGRIVELKIAKIVRETGIERKEIKSLIGTLLKEDHKTFVVLNDELVNAAKKANSKNFYENRINK